MKMAGTISEILRDKGSRVWSISPDAKVFEALQLMTERNIGALPVLEGTKMLGILSERDYARKVALLGRSSRQTTVREIMSAQVVLARPDDSIEECMRLMTETRVRHIPVIHGDQLLGIVSIGDLVKWIISAQSAALHQMENYIAGGYPG